MSVTWWMQRLISRLLLLLCYPLAIPDFDLHAMTSKKTWKEIKGEKQRRGGSR